MTAQTITPDSYGWRTTKKALRLHLVPDGGQPHKHVDGDVAALCGYKSGGSRREDANRRRYWPALAWSAAAEPNRWNPPCAACERKAMKLQPTSHAPAAGEG
jgi:hypothetical protein